MTKTNVQMKSALKAQTAPEQTATVTPLEIPGMRKSAQMGIKTDEEKGTMTILFLDGRRIEVDVAGLSEEIKAKAMWHGLEQKFRDAAALPKGSTLADKFNAVKDVVDTVVGGMWSARREGGENTGGGGLLLQALVRLYPQKSREALQTFVSAKTKAEQATLRKSPKIAAIILEIQAEKVAGSGVNADSLLGELDD